MVNPIMLYRKNNILTRVFLFTAILLLIANLVAAAATQGTMPEFSLKSVTDGHEMTSADFKGKALLVTFFATWCPPCRQEIPSLKKLQEKYTGKGFSVIGLSMDENGPGVVAKLVAKENINYPVLMTDSKIKKSFGGIVGIPTSFLIDREGKIIKRYPGYVPFSMLEKDVKSIL